MNVDLIYGAQSSGIETCLRKRMYVLLWLSHLGRIMAMLLLFLSFTQKACAYELDVFRTQNAVPPVASGMLVVGDKICIFGEVGNPLSLYEAIERALCNNPKTREAWANVKVQAANVGISKGAYLPTVSASWQGVRDRSSTNITGQSQLDTSSLSFVRSETVSLNWVLYDFGARSAGLENAKALLEAAQANQSAVLQAAFAQTAKDFYAAQSAQAGLSAAQEIETQANDSFKAASERVNHGVAPITDALQAQTAYAQAVFNRAKAQGDLQTALGVLASDMSLNPSTPMILPPVMDGIVAEAEFNLSVTELMDEAKRTHPSVASALAQLEAANAKARQTRNQGLPTISFVGKSTQNNQPASLGVGTRDVPSTGRDWYVGVQVSIPIFEGFVRSYQVRQSEFQAEVQQETLTEVRNQVALDVWSSYQTLRTSTENMTNSAILLDSAQHSEDAAEHRYQAGVGNILELLNAQSALATAKKQRIQSLTDWRTARLQLAGKLGRLDMNKVVKD